MYLLDTCIFSELTKKEPSSSVTDWLREKDERLFFVSAMTFGEIKKDIERVTETARKKKLESWLREFLIPRFWERILPINGQVANVWGEYVAASEKKGRVLPTIDSLIAATAITHDLHIVTRNIRDFYGLQLSVINPWEP